MSGLPRQALRKRLFLEGPNPGIQTRRGNGIDRLGKLGNLARVGAAFSLPFRTPAVQQLHLLMPEKAEDPQRVGRPPIGLVAIENHGRFGRNAVAGGEFRERLRRNVVTLHGIVQVLAPINVNGVRNVAGAVKKDVLVAFDDADARDH